MSIYADVRIMGEAEFHNASEDAVSIWITGYSMDYMIRLNIINPLTFIDFVVSGFWGWQESKVANDLTIILNNESTVLLHISRNDSLRGIAIPSLIHIAGLPHNLLRSIHDQHNLSHVRRLGFSDAPTHVPYCLIK